MATPTSTNAAAPASLADITPAPGGVPVPSPSVTFAPVGVLESPGTPGPARSPVPAPSGSDLAALLAGGVPSKAYFASLADPTFATYPLSDETPKSVLGTITSFLPNGFVLALSPLIDDAAANAAGVPYEAAKIAAAESTVAVLVSGKTADLVPGGFGTLHVGDTVMAAGAGAAGGFVADVVLAKLHGASLPEPAANSNVLPIPSTRVRGRRARQAANVNSYTPFHITSQNGNVGFSIPNPPGVLKILTVRCVELDAAFTIAAGAGEKADYPMQLQDVSEPSSFQESFLDDLPVRLVNGYQPSNNGDTMVTYEINQGATVSINFLMKTSNCENLKDATYPLGIATLGQGITSESTDDLPGKGNIALIPHVNCPFIPISLAPGPKSFLLNTAESPSVSLCYDFQLDGDAIYADAEIDNAKVTRVPSFPGSAPFTDSTFSWMSPLPGGDPDVSIIPMPDPETSAVRTNELKLTNFTYNGSLHGYLTVSFGLLFSTPAATYGPFPFLTVFQNPNGSLSPPFPLKPGVAVPATVLLDLTPSEGSAEGGIH